MYDVAIIGAGASGACIARKLSQYELKVALLEKEEDVSFGVSKANSGIIHGGFHSSCTKYLKARLELQGNLMFDQLHKELDFPFKRCGILVVAFSEEQLSTLETLHYQGVQNGAIGIEMCSRERVLDLEPKVNPDVLGGLHVPGGGTVEPYRFVFAVVESAVKNGVELLLNFKVTSAERNSDSYTIVSADGREIEAKYVINAAGLFADKVSEIFNAERYQIHPRKGEEYILDRSSAAYTNKVIFPVPSPNSKGTLVIPTPEGTIMVGPTALEIEDKEDLSTSNDNLQKIFDFAKQIIPQISQRDIISSFAGLRPTMQNEDFFIDSSKIIPNFIHVAGIQSPGLTAAPAIGDYVKDLLKKCGLRMEEKSHFNPYLTRVPRIHNMTPYQVAELTEENPQYGHIICRCEKISEAEIVEAIKRGHTTLDGVKFFTRTGMGRCQGGFCTSHIIKIIMRETGMTYDEITKHGKKSKVLFPRV